MPTAKLAHIWQEGIVQITDYRWENTLFVRGHYTCMIDKVHPLSLQYRDIYN